MQSPTANLAACAKSRPQSNANQIVLIVKPSIDADHHRACSGRGLLFDAHVEGEDHLLAQRTHQPLLDASRILIANGIDSSTHIIMRHAGSSTDALITTVGAAAKLRVKEDDGLPRFRTWVPFPTRPEGSPVRFKRLPAVDLANRNEYAPVTSSGADDGAANEDRQHHVDGDRDRPRSPIAAETMLTARYPLGLPSWPCVLSDGAIERS
jgi:hypothetical protein